MRWLGRLELGLRRLLEGRLGRLLGARMQPVDIAKRLAEVMDDHRVIGAGRVYVPNRFRAALAPRTFSAFAASKSALEADLAAFLDAHAREQGYSLVGRVHVDLRAEGSVPEEDVRVEADLIDRHGVSLAAPGQGTQAIQVAPAAPTPADRTLVILTGGRRYSVAPDRTVTLGRALDCDVILDHPSVSRNHARLSPRAGHWLLQDLESTHGTYVNGRRVSASLVRVGDQLRFGSLLLHLESEGRSES